MFHYLPHSNMVFIYILHITISLLQYIYIGTYVYSHSPLNKTRHFIDPLVNHGKSSLNNYLDPPNTHENGQSQRNNGYIYI